MSFIKKGLAMIYLASPYTHPDPKVREWRHEKVCRMAGQLMLEGLHIFSPIAHSHVIAALAGLPTNWDFWREKDYHIIDRCDALICYHLDGWQDSKGLLAENAYAFSTQKPTIHLEDTNDQRTIHDFSQKLLRQNAGNHEGEKRGLHG